ncbi:DUF1643 domain-containing protein [Streptomyces sp. NPDC058985]|uniref:DUF1643 domain-containing protein n=1 Tax=Streptomyces sp. NPDC058985 TaxID=3346684 RepID=UPI00369BA61C
MLPNTELSVHIEQQATPEGLAAAVFDSSRREYRYLLTRIWDPSVPPVVYVMLNPSTADALTDDPTIRRCRGFARREGAGGLVVVNLFALRSTDPRALTRHPDPVGPHNNAFIRQAVSGAHRVIAAWGAAGVQDGRGEAVTGLLRARGAAVYCLGWTATGQPRHPLYLPSAAVLEPYGVAA